MTKSPFKVYPWPSLDAFEQVVFLLNRTDSESIDAADLEHLVELTWARDQMIAWKNKFHNQHYHELNATCALLNAFCAEIRLKLTRRFRSNQSNKNYHEDDQSLILDQEIASICSGASQQDLCSLYGISLLEFFKMLAYYEVCTLNNSTQATVWLI